jgi:glucose-6-phosphate 1-epimerase
MYVFYFLFLAIFELSDDEGTRFLWNFGFKLIYRIKLTINSLYLELDVINSSDKDWDFSTCLHTYFKTDDIRQVSLTGLKKCQYIDKVDGRKVKREEHESIEIERDSAESTGFVDRIYNCDQLVEGARGSGGGGGESKSDKDFYQLVLRDSSTKSIYHLLHSVSYNETVVFNPWIEGKKGPAHPDFDDDGYNYMICVEPG